MMAIQAIVDSAERMNLIGDVLVLFAVAVVPGILIPREKKAAE